LNSNNNIIPKNEAIFKILNNGNLKLIHNNLLQAKNPNPTSNKNYKFKKQFQTKIPIDIPPLRLYASPSSPETTSAPM